MGKTAESRHCFHFGEFELDPGLRQLRINGRVILLQEQSFQILSALLASPGELVTRKELTDQLWPEGTFVDFEHSLNTAVNRLREVLEDSGGDPRFVETLRRRGYRFIAPVTNTEAPAVVPGIPSLPSDPRKAPEEKSAALTRTPVPFL